VLAKWLSRSPRVLISTSPRAASMSAPNGDLQSHGWDLRPGCGILMISSDLEEILGMSDRVLVLYEGRLAGELDRGNSRKKPS